MSELDDWVAEVVAELGLGDVQVPAKEVLDVARDVAHNVLRPGAPVSAYLLGLAVAAGADPADAAARISALAVGRAKPAE
ncbi:DUF6457 domain-containing protein [Actinoplanes utahensis]|uniref:DUF6457 domain-containing protein n=1 Tax=Actinoplanes utahensis TaxID=1869 RepID=A0A0A6UBR4_ACTUT|nr:DUF6457 domain-containing protein [Actinoplanes utahensis]KHD72906.1 hypothetical protein MB27_37380 [Actinoplanes utahensis]GIF31058.1 hypothetical protein Aut01nite_40440 [Actinoplanes utahensis]